MNISQLSFFGAILGMPTWLFWVTLVKLCMTIAGLVWYFAHKASTCDENNDVDGMELHQIDMALKNLDNQRVLQPHLSRSERNEARRRKRALLKRRELLLKRESQPRPALLSF